MLSLLPSSSNFTIVKARALAFCLFPNSVSEWRRRILYWQDITFETTGILAIGTVKVGSRANDAEDDFFRADDIPAMGKDGDILFSYGE